LARQAGSPEEGERLNYLARHVEFLVPYSESWSLAFHLYQALEKAKDLKNEGKADEAQALVRAQGIPLWLKLAPHVREAILDFQQIAATRNDLGTLASMHNKYERLALFRLPASMKEFLREMPEDVRRAAEQARQPDSKATPRLFVPTRPTVLGRGERVRIFAVAAPGKLKTPPVLFTRLEGKKNWSSSPMKLHGRRTFVGELTASEPGSPFLDYYASAEFEASAGSAQRTAPLEAPARFYTVTLY
ncbi:MAG TPA: hypothetical protein VFZ08_04785, partial [Terriglobia bacterium]|nr:hypothetical protein [Terriglobia bacterium]